MGALPARSYSTWIAKGYVSAVRFLVSYKPDGPVNNLWFSYYKDLRKENGRLKLGYGPGGPPVLGTTDVVTLLGRLVQIGCLKDSQITRGLKIGT